MTLSLSDLPLREELRGHSPYGAPQLQVSNRLNTNENPYPPSEALIATLTSRIESVARQLNRYPDRDCVDLRTALADYVSQRTGETVNCDNVWAANGSNEVLQQILQAFGGQGRTALGFEPSYSMHPILSAGTETEFISCPRNENFDIDVDAALEKIKTARPDIIFITTPNNPTGGTTSLEDIARIVSAAPGIVIVDEAYAEFSQQPSAVSLLREFPSKLIVSRTMSKAFDFAGARLGYFIAHPAFIDAVMLVRLPYHLSALTQAAALAALEHSADTLHTVERLVVERNRVQSSLQEAGYKVIPSEANFVFFGGFTDQHQVWQRFLDEDVLIRDVGVDGFLRVTIGLEKENDVFLAVAHTLAEEMSLKAPTETSSEKENSHE